MSQNEIDILKRALAREKASRKAAEEILEAKSAELYELNKKLEASHSELERLYSKTNSQLQGVFENIVDAYVIMDLWGNILKMNDAAVDLLSFKTKKDSGNLMELVNPKEVYRIAPAFKSLIEDGSMTNFKVNIITNTKEHKLVHINASTIYENGKPVGAQGIVRDITLENKYQQALEAEKQKYSSIIANMNLGLVEVNTEDEILMVNQGFEEISGYQADELIGKKGGELFQFDTNDNTIKIENEKRLKGKSNSYELKVKNKAGELRYWLISGAPNYDLKGNNVGSIGIHLDITELKNLELQKERLLHKLEKSNDELQEYAHIVSHDLKSPLRSIDALVQWIKEDNKGKLDEVTIQNFAHIETTLVKMEQLISDILDYSSVTSNNSKSEKVDLESMLSDLLGMIYLPDHIDIKLLNPLPVLQGDKIKLQQVFQNLITNAIKFNDKKQGIIEIDVKSRKDDFLFSVKDNGIGIDAKFQDKVFKIFHALNKRKDSTGIGLSIVKKIVNLHEGDIWLESKLGEGTTFFFTLKK